MKYILDCNIAFKWFVPELDSDKAIRLRDEYMQNLRRRTACHRYFRSKAIATQNCALSVCVGTLSMLAMRSSDFGLFEVSK